MATNWDDITYFASNFRAVFEKGITDGLISREEVANGSIRYMYSTGEWHWFKHRDTRQHVKVSVQ